MPARKKKERRGGVREGAGRITMFEGKVENGKYIAKRVYGVLTPVGYQALLDKQTELSATEGRAVSLNEAIEWCIRKATRTSMTA